VVPDEDKGIARLEIWEKELLHAEGAQTGRGGEKGGKTHKKPQSQEEKGVRVKIGREEGSSLAWNKNLRVGRTGVGKKETWGHWPKRSGCCAQFRYTGEKGKAKWQDKEIAGE